MRLGKLQLRISVVIDLIQSDLAISAPSSDSSGFTVAIL